MQLLKGTGRLAPLTPSSTCPNCRYWLLKRSPFIDDGDVDMRQALRVYKEIGYDGMMMPDHVPQIQGDSAGAQAFACTFGYIKALIRAVDTEG